MVLTLTRIKERNVESEMDFEITALLKPLPFNDHGNSKTALTTDKAYNAPELPPVSSEAEKKAKKKKSPT
jgi:hypothetical protein